MTEQEFNEQYDAIIEKHEVVLRKLNATKTASSFTETLQRQDDVVRQSLSALLQDLISSYMNTSSEVSGDVE